MSNANTRRCITLQHLYNCLKPQHNQQFEVAICTKAQRNVNLASCRRLGHKTEARDNLESFKLDLLNK